MILYNFNTSMITQRPPSSGAGSFWERLDQNVDEIKVRTRSKLIKYTQEQYQTISHHHHPIYNQRNQRLAKTPRATKNNNYEVSMPENAARIGKSMMTKIEKGEEEKKVVIQNRMSFIRVNHEKQSRTLHQAQQKLQKLITIRSQSLKQKQLLKKIQRQKQNAQKQHKSLLVKQIRQGRSRKSLSVNDWRESIRHNAEEVRRSSLSNDSISSIERQKLGQQNRRKVDFTKKSLEKSRSVISEANSQKIQWVKKRQAEELFARLSEVKSKKKKNSQLLSRLQIQLHKIGEQRHKNLNSIRQYESALGFRGRQSASGFKAVEPAVKSVYLTDI